MESIVERVKDYITSSEGIEARGMADLSPRAVAVMDNYGETDVYFDAESYKLIMEQIWKKDDGTNILFPRALEGTGLGVLEGVGRAPQVSSYDDALGFAKTQLEPIVSEAEFHHHPLIT